MITIGIVMTYCGVTCLESFGEYMISGYSNGILKHGIVIGIAHVRQPREISSFNLHNQLSNDNVRAVLLLTYQN